jgi:hypothetical protein
MQGLGRGPTIWCIVRSLTLFYTRGCFQEKQKKTKICKKKNNNNNPLPTGNPAIPTQQGQIYQNKTITERNKAAKFNKYKSRQFLTFFPKTLHFPK